MIDEWALVTGVLILLCGIIVLVPIVGLTARFALKPMMESIAGFRDWQGQEEALQLLERRVALIEEELTNIDRSLRSLLDEAEFRHQLEAGPVEASSDKT